MNVSQQDAQEALELIQEVTTQTRQAVASGSAPYYMILWGIVWFFGFFLNHFLPGTIGEWIWMGLVSVGILISAVIGLRISSRIRIPGGKRFTLLPVVIICYCVLIIWIAHPMTGEQISVLVVLFAMFGYVIMGILVEPVAIWVGTLTTVLTIIGYYFLLPYYNLWMAFLSGGTLVLGGTFILRKWR